MTEHQEKTLRLWPGAAAVVLQWLLCFVIPRVIPGPVTMAVGLFSGPLGMLLVVVWWAFFSRAPRPDRWGGVLLAVGALVLTFIVLHESVASAMMGMTFFFYATPFSALAFVIWAAATRDSSALLRRMTMVVTVVLATGTWALFRTEGMDGDAKFEFTWRWTPTAEERFLASAVEEPMAVLTATPDTTATAVWPGFRGPRRDGVVTGIRIQTNWSASPPVELWRRQVGPGWSSFAVHGDLVFTQEQRGDNEAVSCYQLSTGRPVWVHGDPVRFWESHAGAGPRATPAVSDSRVYALGATGVLNALDTADGTVAWSRNVVSDTGVKVPHWGFAGSPLVAGDVVIAAVHGMLAAYDRITGQRRWSGPDGGSCYSSPHPLTIDAVPQVVLMSKTGAVSVATADGTVLWEHAWPRARIVQPALITGGDLLLSAGEQTGIRRITVAHGSGKWTVEERWTSRGLKPYFNDFVIHNDHAFGFDGATLVCVALDDGRRRWKGARYGGQLILLSDQGLLLVLSEKGELVLVPADPNGFKEVARFPAITGKTWNHPALIGDILLVRNGREMAAFRLPRTDG